MENKYTELAAVDVSKHIEKKNGLAYLSWAWAVDALLRRDPSATWTFHDPLCFGETLMVSCTVTAFGKPVTMHLPVMDHRNQAVKNPDAFVVNKAMMRCLTKAIACHGLGLYIYAGEDLPLDDKPSAEAVKAALRPNSLTASEMADHRAAIEAADNVDAIRQALNAACVHASEPQRAALQAAASARKGQLKVSA
jgi:hypothetical protein